jgi:hypothetical protein
MVMKIRAVFGVAAGALVGVGELRGWREGGFRGERRRLLGGVVLTRARGAAFIGSRGGRRGMAGMVAMSPGAWLQGVLG